MHKSVLIKRYFITSNIPDNGTEKIDLSLMNGSKNKCNNVSMQFEIELALDLSQIKIYQFGGMESWKKLQGFLEACFAE